MYQINMMVLIDDIKELMNNAVVKRRRVQKIILTKMFRSV